MKIALIAPPFFCVPPKHYGGSEAVVWNLANGLTALGHKVVVFGANDSDIPKDGFVVEYAPELGEDAIQKGIDWREAEGKVHEKIKHLLDSFDIIHGHTWFGWEYTMKKDKPDLRVCHTHHGHLNWNAKIKAPFVTNLMSISRYMQWEYQQIGWSSAYVYNGIDTDLYAFEADKGDRLLYIGRFDSFKRPDIALKVAQKLDMPIDLIGGSKFIQDRGYYDNLVKMVEQYPKAKIHADIPTKDKIPFIQKAKAVIVPSAMREPFGLVAVEALSCGTPVVISKDGGLPEIIDTAQIGAVGKEPKFDARGKAFDDPEEIDVLAMGIKATESVKPIDCRNHAVKYFDRKVMAANYAKLYERMMKGETW